MLLLSSLGILISLLFALLSIWGGFDDYTPAADSLIFLSTGALFFFISLLNLPALILSIRKLSGRSEHKNIPSLYKAASIAMIFWAILVCTGYFLSKTGAAITALAPITVLSIAIPVWWLVEFARKGLERPKSAKEWGTLTIGLTLTPVSIMIIEILFAIIAVVVVLIFLGFQPGRLDQLLVLAESFDPSQGGMEALDQLLSSLAQDPLIAAGLFLIIGVIAPFTEELIKPLAVWFRIRSSLSAKDGFILGLISGGAFALLESAGMVNQISTQDWTEAVLLRAATGVLHIGLSGLVGYGIGRARSEKRWGLAILYLLSAALLHGLWNSMALVSTFSVSPLQVGESYSGFAAGEIISIISMLIIFAIVAYITIRVNRKLRNQQTASKT